MLYGKPHTQLSQAIFISKCRRNFKEIFNYENYTLQYSTADGYGQNLASHNVFFASKWRISSYERLLVPYNGRLSTKTMI